MKKALTAAAVAVLFGVTGCGGDSSSADSEGSEPPSSSAAAPTPTAESSTAAVPPDPEPVPAAPTTPKYDLKAACKKFVAESKFGADAQAYSSDATLARTLVLDGDAEVGTYFGPLIDIAASAAETIGTIDYLDDEAAYIDALTRADKACGRVGVAVFTD